MRQALHAIRIVTSLGVEVDVYFGDVESKSNVPCIVENETEGRRCVR